MLFAKNFPNYVNTINEKGNEILRSDFFDQFRDQIENSLQKAMTSAIDLVQNISSSTIRGVGNIVAALANIIIAIITAPIILFFLLKDGRHVSGYFVKFLPNRMRKPTQKVLTEMNDQVASYIRGQLTVAIAVAIMFVFGFSMINLEFAVTIGVMAGFLNLIPYLGSFLAMLPAIFIALVADPMMLFKVLIVFIIEQTIEGRLISPLVLGSQLKMHPVTILLVLLSSGKIFGVAGVILGIPIYAAVKVIVTHVFEWYRSISSLYEEDRQAEEPEPPDTVADSDDDLES
jgi:predicted PurR-regulated permease PerM